MSDSNATVPPTGFRTELGHLAVKVDGLRPPEMPFLFERKPERMGRALHHVVICIVPFHWSVAARSVARALRWRESADAAESAA